MEDFQYVSDGLINIFLIVLILASVVQPVLLPYKPAGGSKMFYVPQLGQTPSLPDAKSDTTIESSHSGILLKLELDIVKFRTRHFHNFFVC